MLSDPWGQGQLKAVLTLTLNPSLDVTTSAHEVRRTDKLRCTAPQTDPGGGGINAARVINRLGGDTTAIFTAGGANGHTLEALLKREGVSAQAVEIEAPTRQSFTVFERSTHDQFRFVMPGPEMNETEVLRCLDHLESSLADTDYLVASGSLPPGMPDDVYARIARLTKAYGTRLVLDTSGDALAAALDEDVYLIKPNARELRHLAGDKSLDDVALVAFAKELVAGGKCQIVALSLGERGAVLVARNETWSVVPPEIDPKSAVGAGDSFLAALTLDLVRGNDLHHALRYGVAAGTATLLTPGTELCEREDVERIHRDLMTQ